MSYDTVYTITIVASTEERRREIASEIVKHAWLPYLHRKLRDDEFNDPILSFTCRSWRAHELADLAGTWYDEHIRDIDPYVGTIRGIKLQEGEVIILMGENELGSYRIFAARDIILRQVGIVAFINKKYTCPDSEECQGCSVCAEKHVLFPPFNIIS